MKGGGSGVRIPVYAREFLLSKTVQTGSGAHFSVGYRVSLPGIKRPEFDIHYLNVVPMFRMGGAIPPLPKYSVMAWTGTTLLYSRHGFSFPVTGLRSHHHP